MHTMVHMDDREVQGVSEYLTICACCATIQEMLRKRLQLLRVRHEH